MYPVIKEDFALSSVLMYRYLCHVLNLGMTFFLPPLKILAFVVIMKSELCNYLVT
jgi:cytochrome c oxidase subunit IV